MQRYCPICDCNNYKKLTQICNIEQDTMLPNVQEVLACCNCGFVFNSFEETQKDFNLYYQNSSTYGFDFSYSGGSELNEKDNRIFSFIQDMITEDSTILEIGCAKGSLLLKMQEEGYKNIHAIEPSKKCVDFLQSQGIECIQDDIFTQYNGFRNKFDLIIVSHVLEHIVDLKEAILNMKSMLKEDGIIYVEVPDVSRYKDVAKEFTPYFFLPYEHVNHFSLKSFHNFRYLGLSIAKSDDSQYESSNIKVPVVSLILKKMQDSLPLEYNDETYYNLEKYINISEKMLNIDTIKELEKSQREVILWGVGSTTGHILSKGFKNCNVIRVIDSNPAKNNSNVIFENGKTVKLTLPPKDIDSNVLIVILPYLHRANITNQIKSLGYKNEVLVYSSKN